MARLWGPKCARKRGKWAYCPQTQAETSHRVRLSPLSLDVMCWQMEQAIDCGLSLRLWPASRSLAMIRRGATLSTFLSSEMLAQAPMRNGRARSRSRGGRQRVETSDAFPDAGACLIFEVEYVRSLGGGSYGP